MRQLDKETLQQILKPQMDHAVKTNDDDIMDRYNRKLEHCKEVAYLMENDHLAIKLQLDNLVITYGFEAVRSILDKTTLKRAV